MAVQASDSALLVAAAARIASPTLLDRLGDRLPESGPNYDILLRAISLSLLLHPCEGSPPDVSLDASLDDLVAAVAAGRAAMSPEQVRLFDKLAARRCDFRQGQRLRALVPDLSLRRFTEDATYREETVLGLAMSDDAARFELASDLAERYAISRWDLREAHLEFLLTESDADARATIEELGLAAALIADDRDRFLAVMTHKIWPLISGTDHARLELFLALMPPEAPLFGLSVDEHAKVLRKLRSASPGVDYKALATAERAEPLRVLAPHLNSGNVHVFAKLAGHWRTSDGAPLKGSSVFSLWTGRLFWQQAAAAADWVHRFEQCGPFFPRLLPLDFVAFVREAVFSPNSRHIGVDARREILRRAGRLCRQQVAGGGGKRRKAVDDEGEQFRWTDAAAAVHDFLAHVDLCAETLFPRLRALGVPEAEMAPFEVLAPGAAFVEQTLCQLLLWEVAAPTVGELACELGADQEVLTAAVCAATQQLVVAGLADAEEAQRQVSALLERAAQLGPPLNGAASVLSAVKALLMEPDIRSRLGLFLVHLLRSYNDGSEDVGEAVVAQALGVLRDFFDDHWDAAALASDAEARLALVSELAAQSDSVEAMRAVYEALEILGHVSDSEEPRLWTCWLQRAVAFPALGDFVVDVFSRRGGGAKEEALEEAVAAYEAVQPRVAFLLCALSAREELISRSETLLSPEVCSLLTSDQALLRRCLERGWLHHLVGTDLYAACVDLLLAEGSPSLVRDVVRGLRQRGLFLEASNVMADSQHLHPALRTFSVLSSLWGKVAGQ